MRHLGFALIIFGGSLLYDATPAAAEAKPFIWTGIGPKAVTVGQPVTLTVDVYVPTWFTSAPRFPPIDVKDAVVVFLEEGGENMSHIVGEQSYAGQRRQYLIYPQRAGEFVVPPFEVQIRYAIDAQPSPRTPVSSPGARFSATIPEAAAGLGYFVATPSFQLTATTDRPLEGLKVGDSFTRTITMSATQAFAMMLPPLTFPAVDGLAVYPAPPSVSDSGGERDEVRVGRRVESVTYVLQKEGAFHLPPTEVAWWDTGARTLRRAQLSAVDFTVAPNPALKAEIPLPPDPAELSATPPPFDWRVFLRTYGPRALGIFAALGLLLRLLQSADPLRARPLPRPTPPARRIGRRLPQEARASGALGHARPGPRSHVPLARPAATPRAGRASRPLRQGERRPRPSPSRRHARGPGARRRPRARVAGRLRGGPEEDGTRHPRRTFARGPRPIEPAGLVRPHTTKVL